MIDSTHVIDHLKECIFSAISSCDEFGGPPQLDYKKYRKERPRFDVLFRETVRRAKMITRLEASHKNRFLMTMKKMKDNYIARLKEDVDNMEREAESSAGGH